MAKKKNDALRFQQIEAGKQALGAYQPLLQWAMQNAGLQQTPPAQNPLQLPQPAARPVTPQPSVRPLAGRGAFGVRQPATPAPPPMASVQPVNPMPTPPMTPSVQPPASGGFLGGPGVSQSQLGIFGQGADALRFQQAEEDINDAARQRANLLRFRLGQQGIGNSGTMASALAQNERGAMDSLADFRRNLAINAGGEQERRMQLLAQLLGLGQGIGSQGQQVSGMYKQISASKPNLIGQLAQFAPLFI